MAEAFDWPGHLHAQFQGLLDDVRTRPDDGDLRLILADWLDEHADGLPTTEADSASAWSSLMRIQCRRQSISGGVTHEERELLARYEGRWLGDLLAAGIDMEWRSGFVALSGPVTDLYTAVKGCDEAVFTRVLWLRPNGNGLGRGRYLEALLGLPQLSGLGVLELALTNPGEIAARALARSPHLAGLRHLTARNVGFGSTEFAHLAGSSFLRLESLDLGYNAAGDEGVIALAESPICAGLRALRLQRVNLSDEGARALLESKHFENLCELSLYGNRDISPTMARRLEQRWGLGFSW